MISKNHNSFIPVLVIAGLIILQLSSFNPVKASGNIRLVFYNVENLFDTINDPVKDDDSFTPAGERRWNYRRLENKLSNLYKALAAAGEWNTPAIIGLCEVENHQVLDLLIQSTGLKNAGYNIVHRNSADSRGIDVAVLFQTGKFSLLHQDFISIIFPFDTAGRTRDIVYISGMTESSDTLHVFINHWPSRWGGQAITVPYRNHVAGVLKSLTDSVFLVNPMAKIVIMGDFNDEPGDESLRGHLEASLDYELPEAGKLYNISNEIKKGKSGSYKYQGLWYLFDQFIVSGSLMTCTSMLRTSPQSVKVINADFLLVPDKTWFGDKPFRSYEGFRYTGGFSDHLPVVLDLWW